MKLLILGGTSDALALCRCALTQYRVIYSIKGLVRQPQLNTEIHSGGFGGVQGMINFLQQQQIDCLLDATHPYAVTISHHAQQAAKYCALPCYHYLRPAWQKQEKDQWILFKNMTALTQLLNKNETHNAQLFFTIGQISADFLLNKNPQQHYIIRSALAPSIKQTTNIHWIKSIGPFSDRNENKLFKQYQFDALISKNSGGDSVAAKIKIARQRGIPIYMLERPEFHSMYPIFHSITDLLLAVKNNSNFYLNRVNIHFLTQKWRISGGR